MNAIINIAYISETNILNIHNAHEKIAPNAIILLLLVISDNFPIYNKKKNIAIVPNVPTTPTEYKLPKAKNTNNGHIRLVTRFNIPSINIIPKKIRRFFSIRRKFLTEK